MKEQVMETIENEKAEKTIGKSGGVIRNPLGIIALFVTIVYGITGFVISANFNNLHGACERQPLIWFIVLFPVILLVAFVVLVMVKPLNLYGPSDFKNPDKFIEALDKTLRPNKTPKTLKKPEKISFKKNHKSWCFISHSSHSCANDQFDNVEEAAMQKYADEHNLEIKTNVYISQNVYCDGVAEQNGKLYLFEVKENYTPKIVDNLVKKLIRMQRAMASKGCTNLHLVVILVSTSKMKAEDLDDLQIKLKDELFGCEMVNYVKDEIC